MSTRERLRRAAKRRLTRKPKVHILHNRKTAGSAVKHALQPFDMTGPYHLVLHGPPGTIEHIPVGESFVFNVRHPVSRFVSGFNGRRASAAADGKPLSAEQVELYERFEGPNDLAEGLSASSTEVRAAAERGMGAVHHFNSYWDKFITEEYLLSRRDDIFMILFQENLNADFDELARRLEVDASLPTDPGTANRAPSSSDKYLSEVGTANLEDWFTADIEFYTLCQRLRG